MSFILWTIYCGRTLDVNEDNETSKVEDEDDGYTVPGLHCKIIVRYKEYDDFCNALKVLSGRSLEKVVGFYHVDFSLLWLLVEWGCKMVEFVGVIILVPFVIMFLTAFMITKRHVTYYIFSIIFSVVLLLSPMHVAYTS